MDKLVLIPSRCKQCGLCVAFCPQEAISFSDAFNEGGYRPTQVDDAKCIKCGICYIFCPEACISETAEGFFEANLDYCKGCGICAHECWPRAIAMVEEEV